MSFLKDIKEIKSTNQEIKNILVGNVTKRAERADELEGYLSNIRFKVKSINELTNSDGRKDLKIAYTIPDIILTLDETGEPIEDKNLAIFRAINMLNLIDFDDMDKIVVYLSKLKNEI